MRELKTTKTIEETYGYEANDGAFFKTKEECEKYEGTARQVIYNDLKRLFIGDAFSEISIWEGYGNGNDEWLMAVIEIKNNDDLFTVNKFIEAFGFIDYRDGLDKSFIGKRLLVNLGYMGNLGDCNLCPRTEEEMIEGFKNTMNYWFHDQPNVREEDKVNATKSMY